MAFSFYFAHKRERLRLKKLEKERDNIAKIHEELNSLR
jgi:hypothetical protein